MKKLILFLSTIVFLNAEILKDIELDKLKDEKEKSSLEAQLLKDSWINPLSLSADITKNENFNIKSSNKKIYLDFNQDIFRSGGIFYTIKKAKEQKKLSFINFENNLLNKKTEAIKLVLNIQKIDLQIKKQDYLVLNKKIEIEKKQEEYLSGIINIESLDTAIIEKNNLENQIEDLKLTKAILIKDLKKYSHISYSKIKPEKLELISLKSFLEDNKELIINKIKSSIARYDKDITASNYLPKVSAFSQYGYEDSSSSDSFYSYGLRIKIPLDFNMKKNKEISKLKYRISKLNEKLKYDEKVDDYELKIKSINHINKKINNSQETIASYEKIYALTNDLVEGLIKTKGDLKTIENRLNSSKLDIAILNIDKQLLIYEIRKYTN